MIPPFSSKTNGQELSYLPIHVATRGTSPTSSPNSYSPDSQSAIRQLARVEAIASLISITAIVSLVYIGHFVNLRLQLPRLLVLLATAVLTERAFSPSEHFSPKYNRSRTNIRRLSIALQIVWVLSELAFSSAFAPLLLAAAPSLALSLPGTIALCLLPLAAMVTLTGCLEFFSRLRNKRRHRRLSSVNSEDFAQLTAQNKNTTSTSSGKYPSSASLSQQQYASDTYTTPPLSPADSFASGSSGALASGLPSPTGHCPSPDRAAMLRYAATIQEHEGEGIPTARDVYLKEHILGTVDTNESMLFVHKILKPIKTRIGDQETAPAADYKPLLQQLMAQSTKQSSNYNKAAAMAVMQPCPPLFQPAVVATVTVVKGKGGSYSTNQPPVPIPVIT